MTREPGWKWILLIAGIALLVRLAYLLEVRNLPEFQVLVLDPHIHDSIARVIADGNLIGGEAFFRAPLYLYLTGFLYFIFGASPWSARLLQVILGAAGSVLAYRIGRRCFSEWVGRVAGLVTALTWTLVYFDGELLITSLVTFLDLLLVERLITAADSPSGRRWFVCGVVLGLSAIARPTILVFGWLAVVWIWRVLRDAGSSAPRIRAAALYLLGSLLIIAPVTVRNAVAGRDFVLISSQGGINFYLGNNPYASGWSATSPEIGRDWWGGFDDAVWIAEKQAGRPLKPSEVSRYWTSRGLKFWVEQPSEALSLGLRKLFFFWGGAELGNNRDIEFSRTASWVLRVLPFSFGWIAPLALLGIVTSARRREQVLLVLFVLLYMATVVLFFVCARFRMPVVPPLAILGVAGAGWLVREVKAGRWSMLAPACAGLVLLTVFLRLDPYQVRDAQHTQSYFNLGLIYNKLGDAAAAEKAYRQALERDPTYVDASINLGALYVRQEKLADARRLYEQVLASDPGHAKAIYNLGAIHERQGNLPAAESAYTQALSVDPHFLPAIAGLGRMLEAKGDLTLAGRVYQQAFDQYRSKGGLGPGDIRVRFEEEAGVRRGEIAVALGRVAQKQGLWTAALRHYRKALELAPEAEQAHYRVGFALMQARHYEEAMEEMRRELALFPDSIPARYALGLCYASTGSILPAIRELKGVTAADPNHDRAWQNLGALYARSQSYDEAIQAFRRALEINPDNEQAKRHLELAEEYQFRE